MNRQSTLEATTPGREVFIFFKCPVGGFASLQPRLCPKCNEPLEPVKASAASADHVETERPTDPLSFRRVV